MVVDVPKMRAYINLNAADHAQLQFTYLGATATQSALASGASRVQFGLKLHADDPCNLVYAMWRIEPESKLVISVKTNPGQHSSLECGNRGYQNIKPSVSLPVPRITPGQSHTLDAALHGNQLRAYVDDRLVWQGDLGQQAARLKGPAGVRSDNAHLEFELAADNTALGAKAVPGCRAGPQESE
jgi:hypothetical protein